MTSLADSGKVLWKASILLLAGLVVGNIQMVLIWPPSEISSQTVIARWLLAAKSPAFAMRWQQLSTLTAVRKPCLAPGVPRRGRLFFLPPALPPEAPLITLPSPRPRFYKRWSVHCRDPWAQMQAEKCDISIILKYRLRSNHVSGSCKPRSKESPLVRRRTAFQCLVSPGRWFLGTPAGNSRTGIGTTTYLAWGWGDQVLTCSGKMWTKNLHLCTSISSSVKWVNKSPSS